MAASPVERRVAADVPNRDQVVAEEKARYEDFAASVAQVAYDPTVTPLYSGPQGRAKTAVVLLTLAWYESGFRKDVDTGVGPRSRGDGGRSCTAWQFNIGNGRTREGHTCQEMYADRTLAVRSALATIRTSMSMCRSLAPEYRWSAYTAGHCEDGQEQSKSRVNTARRWLEKYAPPMNDAKAMEDGQLEAKGNTASIVGE